VDYDDGWMRSVPKFKEGFAIKSRKSLLDTVIYEASFAVKSFLNTL